MAAWRAVNLAKTQTELAIVLFVSFSCCSGQSLHPDGAIVGDAAHGAARLRRIAIGTAAGSFTGFAAAITFLYALRLAVLFARHAPLRRGVVVFSPDVKNLKSALAGDAALTSVIGGGPIGRYYKVVLDNETTVAVKWVDNAQPAGAATSKPGLRRRVRRHLEFLSRAEHGNVMSLKAYAVDGARLALAYYYMPTGSLEDAMKRVRARQAALPWATRARIAVGVAKGLRHLHFECSPTILHCGLKPSNVLLDDGLEPRLTDYGQSFLLGCHCSNSSPFAAPECHQNCRLTEKADVYAFGMILAILLTGMDPDDSSFAGEPGGLPRWLRRIQHAGDAAEQALDLTWAVEDGAAEQMLMACRIAVLCLSDVPGDRPSSDELVVMLAQICSL